MMFTPQSWDHISNMARREFAGFVKLIYSYASSVRLQ